MNITEFLEARIAEDEKMATYYGSLALGTARVLAECAAKRAIIAECRQSTLDDLSGGDDDQPVPIWVARALASVYADHPDYRQEWAG